jgi:hypothetical protein
MKIYLGCIVYKKGKFWIIEDDTKEWKGTVIGKYTDYEFLRTDKVNDFEIIRNWRKEHPATGY